MTGCGESAAARRLEVTIQRVSQLRQAGKIKATQTPLGWLYDLDDLERLRRARQRRQALAVIRRA